MDALQQTCDNMVSCWSCLQHQNSQEAEPVREEGGLYFFFSLFSLFSVLVWELGMIVHLMSIFSTLLANTTDFFYY